MVFLSITAITTSISLFFAGAEICLRIKRKGNTDGIGSAPFLVTFLSCAFWLQYGVLKDDHAVIMVNFIGCMMEGVYIWYYNIKTRNRRRFHKILFIECSIIIYKIENLGTICVIFNILTNSAPLVDLHTVIKTKSTESMPLPIILAALAGSVQWYLYGFLSNDIYLQIPNGLSVFLCSLQLALFWIYPSNKKPNNSNDEKNLISSEIC
ncbi:Sugar transporter SWEET1 [Strongyloides ratti]|uniref:Sugar transporter SWEET1 n=1 Tax=Strongyloides ratti TaxID=34506 RepID=A0A090LCB4_STRRB|nr:Sugar transporter SWEET1 [Strongyloides ratti]CEF67412.1 Sugar transporter SWEET1 [Strongyloides ratti]